MKKIILLLLTITCGALFGAVPRNTADFYKGNPSQWLGKQVTIYISDIKPSSFVAKDGYVSFHCFTAYQGADGGYIYALVKSDKAKAFMRDYSNVKPNATSKDQYGLSNNDFEAAAKICKGIFYKIKWDSGAEEYILIIN